jgi:predicted MPP superfamily phosphohydrolase
MCNHVESLTWLTDLHLEFCSHRTRDRFYHSINQAPGEIVIITGDLSAGPHRLGQYTELAEQIRKPIYFVLGNHDRYGTTFENAEAVVERVTTLLAKRLACLDDSLIFRAEQISLPSVLAHAQYIEPRFGFFDRVVRFDYVAVFCFNVSLCATR